MWKNGSICQSHEWDYHCGHVCKRGCTDQYCDHYIYYKISQRMYHPHMMIQPENDIARRLIANLERFGIDFVMTEHQPVYTSVEAAEVRGSSLHSGAKALIVKGDENKIVNTLIQGMACNVLKHTMLKVRDLIKDEDTHMIQQIHDENIFEIPTGDKAIVPLIKSIMEDVDCVDLPLVVDVEWSQTNWADKTKYPDEELQRWTMTNH